MNDSLREDVLRMHAQVCSALADPNRLLIIYSLAEGPRCVKDIAAAMDVPQPTISRHLKSCANEALCALNATGNAFTIA